jgi:Na+/H+ antiporter NhaC
LAWNLLIIIECGAFFNQFFRGAKMSDNHDTKNRSEKLMQFYGGKAGAWFPLIMMLVLMILLVIAHRASSVGFWAPTFAALCLGFLLAKNKKEFSSVALKGLQDPIFSMLILLFFMAGILSQLLRQSGLINGLLWVSSSLHLTGRFLPAIIFLTCVIISTSCGTTAGTASTVTPVMFPLAVGLGCDQALVLGAIISGSYFGDNLAPISDTTIASSSMMNAEVPKVVKSRVKYSVAAGLISLVLYIILGIMTTHQVAGGKAMDSHYAIMLIMLLIPVAMVIMMKIGMEIIPVLIVCDLIGIVLNLGLGFMAPVKLIDIKGPVIGGINGMVGIVVFEAFLFAILELVKASGGLAMIINKIRKACKTPRQAELASFFMSVLTNLATSTNTISIIMVGPIVRQLYMDFGMDRERGANIMDGTTCGICGILPYNSSLMIMFSLAAASGALSPNISLMSIPKYSFHCIFLLAVFLFAIFTGWGRKHEVYSSEEIASVKSGI